MPSKVPNPITVIVDNFPVIHDSINVHVGNLSFPDTLLISDCSSSAVLAQWAVAVTTLFAALVAIFKDSAIEYWRRPIISASDEELTFVEHTINTPVDESANGGCTETPTASSYDCFLNVTNLGRGPCKNIQCFLEKVKWFENFGRQIAVS